MNVYLSVVIWILCRTKYVNGLSHLEVKVCPTVFCFELTQSGFCIQILYENRNEGAYPREVGHLLSTDRQVWDGQCGSSRWG